MLQFTTFFGERSGKAERLLPRVSYHGNDSQTLFCPKACKFHKYSLYLHRQSIINYVKL